MCSEDRVHKSSLDRSRNVSECSEEFIINPRKRGLSPRHPFKGCSAPPHPPPCSQGIWGGGSPPGPLNKNQNGTLISTVRIVLTCVNHRSEGCFEVSWHVYVAKSPKASPRSPPALPVP